MEGNEESDEVISKKAKYAQIIEWVFFKNREGRPVSKQDTNKSTGRHT
jgi:hypothetical protein